MFNESLNAILLGVGLAFMIGPVFFTLIETSVTKGARAAIVFDLGVILGDISFILLSYDLKQGESFPNQQQCPDTLPYSSMPYMLPYTDTPESVHQAQSLATESGGTASWQVTAAATTQTAWGALGASPSASLGSRAWL